MARVATCLGAAALVALPLFAPATAEPRTASILAEPADPVKVVLTSKEGTSLPAPGRPPARVELTMSHPTVRPDGLLRSVLRIRKLMLPEHRGYFLRAEYGSEARYLCESATCRGPIPWLYSARTLKKMRLYGTTIEAFIGAPSGHIWSVAGGMLDARKLVAPPLAGLADLSRGDLSSRLTPKEVTHRPGGLRPRARGTFSGSVWPFGRGTVSFRFGMTTRQLTGPALEAHVHSGAPGREGPILVTLCEDRRCNLSSKTFLGLPENLVETMSVLGAYVDVHTKRNPRGEIRGQIVIR